ncbi:MAG: hypothetical protein HY291_12500 [Planctomycetes bacterium]|nr:hypothetical protein [Planctomycetota bacterium]
MIVKGGSWANGACRTLAEILDLARKNKQVLQLSAQEWFDAAHGCFLEGQMAFRDAQEKRAAGEAGVAEELQAGGRKQFEQAAQAYRKVIAVARKNAAQDPLTRLTLEPRAWLELGLCYAKLDAYAEALLAFDELRTQFGRDGLVKWWREMPNARIFLLKPEVKTALEKLERVDAGDFQNDGVLHAGETALRFAFERYRARHPGEQPPVTPKDWKEEEALAGKRLLDDAQARKAAALQVLLEGRAEEGVKLAREALGKYREAAAAFEKVPGADKYYEVALYHAPVCYALAQGLAAEKTLAARMPAGESEALRAEFGRKALEGFAAYETYLSRQSPQDTDTFARRERYARALALTRAAVHFNLKNWAAAIAACDAYLDLERERPQAPEESRAGDAYFLKFQALAQLAGEKPPPECDAPLDAANALLPELQGHEDRHAFALQSLIARYSAAAERAGEAHLPRAAAAAYHSKIADLLALGMPKDAKPAMDDLLRLLQHLRAAGRAREAADAADLALKTYDPEKKNAHIDDEVWPAVYERMTRIIRYDDLAKWERCKRDHLALLDFLYETPQGAAMEAHPEKRPEQDKYPVNYEKALAQLATIRANYADCGTNRPAPGKPEQLLEGKGFLQAIEDEIVLRRRLIALRDALIEMALQAAEQAEEKDASAAERYRALADEQIRVLMETWYGETPAMKIKSAQIRAANKDYAGAEKMLREVKASEPDTSTEIYVQASRMLAETCFKMKRFEEAAEYPQFLYGLGLRNGWVQWPDVEDFLERCYASGAKRPANAKK